MKEIKPLTAMRGIFALWVLGYHLHTLRVAPTPSIYGLLSRGYLGVDFFFMLSGFILAGRYGESFQQSINLKDYVAFIIQRIFRMMPLNIAVTLACTIGILYFDGSFPIIQVVEEALLIHRWPGVPALFHAINGPSWSISTELLTNIGFPIFVIFTLKPNKYVAFFILVLASTTCLWLTMTNEWELDIARANSPEPFIRCAAEFAIGMLIFRWHKTHIGPPKILLPLLGLSVLISLHFGLIDLGIVVLMSVVIPLLAQDSGRIARILSISPFIWLGNLSFSIYLTQEPIMRVVRHYIWLNINNQNEELFAYFFFSMALTIMVSWLTNKYIENVIRIYT